MSDVIPLNEPSKEHYSFVSWYSNPYFEGSPVWVIPGGTSGNVTLYAKWIPMTYSIIYRDGVDEETVFSDMVFVREYNTRTPDFGTNPTREGYTFVGWDKEISAYVTGDAVYNAVWEKNHIHTEVIDKAVAPTCTATGLTEGWHCGECGDVLVAQETVAAVGHDWKEATTEAPRTCRTCGETEGEKLPATEAPDNDAESWFARLWRSICEFFARLLAFLRKGFSK